MCIRDRSYGDDPRAFREHVKELAPNGIDVAVDMVGGPHLEAIVRSMAFDGRCVVVGCVEISTGTISRRWRETPEI